MFFVHAVFINWYFKQCLFKLHLVKPILSNHSCRKHTNDADDTTDAAKPNGTIAVHAAKPDDATESNDAAANAPTTDATAAADDAAATDDATTNARR